MTLVQKLYIVDGGYGSMLEPGKVFERKKRLLVSNQDPNSLHVDLCDFSFQSALATGVDFIAVFLD